MKRLVMEKRDHVYRAHNEYVLKVREYNFIDEQYVRKIHNLLIYHEETQLILNRQWFVKKSLFLYTTLFILNRRSLLDSIANYMNNDLGNSNKNVQSLQQILCSAEPLHCYDELCKIHSKFVLFIYSFFIFVHLNYFQSITSKTTNPIVFNDILLQISGLFNLEANKIIIDDSTINNLTVDVLRQKFE